MIANILFSFIASSSCILLQTNQIAFTLFESPWTLLTRLATESPWTLLTRRATELIK